MGGGYAKLIVTLLVLGAIAYVGLQVVPPYLHNYQLKDYVNDLVLESVSNRIQPADIPAAVAARAGALSLPVDPENVTVDAGGVKVTIQVSYTVPVDLKVYTWPIHFSVSASAPRLAY